MLPLLAAAALAANHVHTFVADPAYTPAPFQGLEQLFVDPTATAPALRPLAARPQAEPVADAPGQARLVFTSPLSQWGEVTVNDTRIGILGPYGTMTLEGVAAGWYTVNVKVPTGFSRTFAVQVAER